MIPPHIFWGNSLTIRVTPGLDRWAWPNIFWAPLGGWLSSHAGLCKKGALDNQQHRCEVEGLYNDGHQMVTMERAPIGKGLAGCQAPGSQVQLKHETGKCPICVGRGAS